MPLVVPTPIPAYPPAPQPTDDRVSFSTKAFALAAAYEPQRLAFNTALGQVYTNSQWAQTKAQEAQQAASSADDSADAAHVSRVAADQAVQDVRDAMASIQAGPVASVMGRTGVVTGLAERSGPIYTKAVSMASAPLGQWASYNDGTGAGPDWPTSLAISCWNVFTYGTALRKTQRASQVLEGTQQGWIFERQLHDAVWSPWQRVLGDRTLIELSAGGGITTSGFLINPSLGSVQQYGIQTSVTLSITPARSPGDQVTFCAHMQGAFSITLGANIALPIGASLPTVANGEMLMLIFTAKYDNTWYCSIGGKYPG
ncbi:hypothetical protein [Comamonas squillarum]|uniref:Tail fiber protein n=1 Tax=Comamonas squillarum TaxID=2977320 RepID=A0ABY6A1L0_9BURK|nr:hypothetical protein [Comamonas sp. PR12]UXC20153.1 hypothetical protein N4T19_08610 [Comamonas sp. PR12]